jgi:hypothetical protein
VIGDDMVCNGRSVKKTSGGSVRVDERGLADD